MENLELIKSENFGDVECDFYRNLDTGETYMTRTQIGQALEYTNPRIAIAKIHSRNKDRLDKFSGVTNLVTVDGKTRETVLYNAKGVYEICRLSSQPKANQFFDWVYDVLERIRTTGGYIAGEENMSEDELVYRAMQVLQRKLLEKDKLLEEQKPKVVFADAVETSNSCILIGNLAKILRQNGVNIGQNRLFEWLRNNEYLMKSGERKNMPTQKSMDLELFEVKVSTIVNPDGSIRTTRTTKCTPKGQIYFINKFLETTKESEVK